MGETHDTEVKKLCGSAGNTCDQPVPLNNNAFPIESTAMQNFKDTQETDLGLDTNKLAICSFDLCTATVEALETGVTEVVNEKVNTVVVRTVRMTEKSITTILLLVVDLDLLFLSKFSDVGDEI